ncbi:MAG: 23S rRNA (adenine(2503)-C(2))-methyltransferase RlmN [Anaerolineae bacterium]|nr:23S rRNA (adenine(2503)-C(2))-methyltransferase RlmN [Anaerolineae bacterium]
MQKPLQSKTETAVPSPNLYDYTYPELTQLLANWGYSSYHVDKLWQALYQSQVQSLSEINVRDDLRQKLESAVKIGVLGTETAVASNDGLTHKFLLKLADGETIETVLMGFTGRDGIPRATACISTQVGCAMGCVFCATGQMGFTRHLSPGEIVAQALYVNQILQQSGDRLRNIVLMGMGEPLHNYDATMAAIDILTDHKGLALAPRHITLSTVGVVPGILRLADEETRPVRLAVSLHGATDAERQALVPPARRWPLAELMAACRTYIAKRGRRIFFEWTLIEGKNDTSEQAHALGALLQGMDAHVNLIPLNPTLGYNGLPTRTDSVQAFQAILATYNLPSTMRQRRGIDIAAGCGQLKSIVIT